MANYRAVKGLTIQTVSSDPPNPVSGQIWYNSTLGKIKAASVSGWATGGNLNTARAAGIGAGTQTAALHISGNPDRTIVEAYDGSSWSEGPDLNAQKMNGSGGGASSAAAIATGGNAENTLITACETYDGSSWTEVGDLNSGRQHAASCTPSSAAVLFTGGQQNIFGPAANIISAATEEWNGTSWTEVGDLNTKRFQFTGCGTPTAGMVAGGNVNPPTDYIDEVEQYNGTSWTETTDVPDSTAAGMGVAGLGTQTAGFWYGGTTPGPATAGFFWDGSAWSAAPTLSTGRPNMYNQAGTQTSALATGNDPAANVNEEYSDPAIVTWETT